jgi:tRNA-2-methylthio-N6-dimethylallyladenosine synthase
MRGCNNFCTFCVVPYTRGRERSRDPENVVAEVEALVAEGFTQVTLLGQNVNSYKSNGYDFADLLQMVSDVPGIRRIRYTSPHPKDFPTKLLTVMAERDNVCKQIHMPLQAGADRVLKAMNRTYTNAEFRERIAQAQEMVPGVSLSTDIIVGFPTETDAEFEETVKVVEEIAFDTAFIFKYSERPLTYASRRLPDDVPEGEKTRRIMILNDIQRAITLRNNRALIGTTEEVLIDRESTRKSPDDFQGRTEANRIVIIPRGPYKAGDYVMVEMTDATSQVLKGRVVHL